MKNLCVWTAIAVLSVFSMSAQSDKGDFTLAPQVGLNLSTYSSDVSYNNRTALTAGVVAEYYFSDRWSLRSAIIYDPMGAEDSFNITDKLNYITIPINANWHFGSTRKWYLNFGPAISILASAKSEASSGEEVDIKDFVSNPDIGLTIGIGYKFNINENTQLYIDYQGYGGFTNIDDTGALPFDIRNSRSAFNLGVVFQL